MVAAGQRLRQSQHSGAQVPEEASPSEEIAEVREEAPEPTQEESEAPSVESEEGDSTGKAE